ncbi:UNVERIFIED_CONTAM: hypothetical protein GTU68_003262 [Idotea baltica]|nr:hypothetical protein [Idotea baltica]
MVGTDLCARLVAEGHEVGRLVRRPAKADDEVQWNVVDGTIESEKLEGCHAIIHLAGENIAGSRWNDAFKARIRDSRVDGTRLLAEAVAGLDSPPSVVVCASAIGYYGDRADEQMFEDSSVGDDFLADVCKQWEDAADPLRAKGIRTVHLRIGVILSTKGGALAKMLFPFKMGGGGVIGNGKQYWSWVSLDDVVGGLIHCMNTPELSGPVNGTSPEPATNYAFTKTLGKVLKRPTILPMPAFAVKLAFGEMGEALMLASTRVIPKKLVESGYQFEYPGLESAFKRAVHERG